MKVLAVSASPRSGGNSDILCDQFLKGAAESGHETEKISIGHKNIHPCMACYGCRKTKVCVSKDDM
ncbi:MAG: flavodoxin family protein, partial [Lachnospiraceae bacterium]|nr:flavodoxin family protein [Lachnospiraceae bacterium]